MLSNPVCCKPFRGARREVSGATLEREGAAIMHLSERRFPALKNNAITELRPRLA